MKTDIDQLMLDNNLDAIWVTGPAQHNPAMYYFTGPVHVTQAELIKKRSQQPVLFCNPMEREEAALSGLPTRNFGDFHLMDVLKEVEGDVFKAYAIVYNRMLADLDITQGRIAIFGQRDIGTAYGLFTALQQAMPAVELVGQPGTSSILIEAMATKDAQEVERIRNMGRITTEVVGLTADFLTGHKVKDEVLMKGDDSPLTIGDVKKRINLWLAEREAENPEGTIFAIGRDAGIPHSSGNPDDFMRLGKTIVYDIFPCEAGGGYYYDFTRTWCLGYATDEALALYEDVRSVFDQMMRELRANTPCRDYQIRTCELFEAQGHPTILSDLQTQEGYVHSLGHGLGLHVHENPSFSQFAKETSLLIPGSVVTIEPGLYYPEREMGVRLEDTVTVHPDGRIEVLAEFPLDLILPMK